MTSLKIYISSHEEVRKAKFGQQVNLIQKGSTGYSASGGSDTITL